MLSLTSRLGGLSLASRDLGEEIVFLSSLYCSLPPPALLVNIPESELAKGKQRTCWSQPLERFSHCFNFTDKMAYCFLVFRDSVGILQDVWARWGEPSGEWVALISLPGPGVLVIIGKPTSKLGTIQVLSILFLYLVSSFSAFDIPGFPFTYVFALWLRNVMLCPLCP